MIFIKRALIIICIAGIAGLIPPVGAALAVTYTWHLTRCDKARDARIKKETQYWANYVQALREDKGR
jgi:hypothetical protein